MKMCLNKINGCSGCSATNGCCRLRFDKVQNKKKLPPSFESDYINITTSQFSAAVISNMGKNAANFARQRAVNKHSSQA